MIEQERLTPTEEAKWLAEKSLGVRQCAAVSRAGRLRPDWKREITSLKESVGGKVRVKA